jgi:hypothetical protein
LAAAAEETASRRSSASASRLQNCVECPTNGNSACAAPARALQLVLALLQQPLRGSFVFFQLMTEVACSRKVFLQLVRGVSDVIDQCQRML